MYFYKDIHENIFESSIKICPGIKYKLKIYNTNKYYIVDNLIQIDNPNICLTFHSDPIITSSGEQFITTNYLASNNFFTSYKRGVNITGFDNRGDQQDIDIKNSLFTEMLFRENHYTINLIDDKFNQYILDNSIQIVRLPVLPFYLFNRFLDKPFSEDNNIFTSLLNGKYNDKCLCTNEICPAKGGLPYLKCISNNNIYQEGCPNYLYAIKKFISKKIYCIIDVHSDTYNLCSISKNKDKKEPMSPLEFINMWKYIVQYILETIEPKYHQYILFELCNEPIGNSNCQPIKGCNQNAIKYEHPSRFSDGNRNCQQRYDLSYQIPTINAIRDLETKYNSPSHIIIVTTYNNWSGVHFWKTDGTLEQLAIDLCNNNYSDSKKSNIIIAGHQYCDDDWSGTVLEGGCVIKFKDNIQDWIANADTILNKYNLKWFQTEGNVMNPKQSEWHNALFYNNWLQDISNSTSNIGYTLWFMNQGTTTDSNANKDPDHNVTIAQINANYNYINYYKQIYNKNNKKSFLKYTDEITFPIYNFNNLLLE